MPRPVRLLPWLAVVGAVACAPARRREGAVAVAAGHAAAAVARAADPVALAALDRDPFFAGIEEVARSLPVHAHEIVAEPGRPWIARDPVLERLVRDRATEEGRRDVRSLFAFGAIAHVPAPPARAADALLDPAREKAALDADELTLLARVPSPTGDRAAFAISMLRMGEGPVREDFVWDFQVARRDRPDGSVLLRYERSTARGPGLHVTVFRGAGILVPEGDGTRWLEVLVVGSDVAAPFFLAGKVEGGVRAVLARRWTRLST